MLQQRPRRNQGAITTSYTTLYQSLMRVFILLFLGSHSPTHPLHITGARLAQRTSGLSPDASLLCRCSQTSLTPQVPPLSLLAISSLPPVCVQNPSSLWQLLCQMGQQLWQRRARHRPAGVRIPPGSLAELAPSFLSTTATAPAAEAPGLCDTVSTQIWLYFSSEMHVLHSACKCQVKLLPVGSIHGAGCAEAVFSRGCQPCKNQHPVAPPGPTSGSDRHPKVPLHSHTKHLQPPTSQTNSPGRTAPLTDLQTAPQDHPTQLNFCYACCEAAASRTAPGAPSKASLLPRSPTHFPILFLLGEGRATRTICLPSERPPGSAGF